jgi:hypothetical protein
MTLPIQWRKTTLDDLCGQYERHLYRWFPEDQGKSAIAKLTQDKSLLSPAEYQILRWFDLAQILKIRFELTTCVEALSSVSATLACLQAAEAFVVQTERVAYVGALVYLQDISATQLSAFGTILYKVDGPSSEADFHS